MTDRKHLIALDLDGTLLDNNATLSERNAAAIHAVHAAGHHVVIATGRPINLVTGLADQLGDSIAYVVGTNGSTICTFPDGHLVQLIGFDYVTAVEAVTRLRDGLPGIGFAIATDSGLAHQPGFAERMPAVVDQDPVPDILAVGGSEVYKLFAFHDDLSVAQLLERAPEYLPAGLAANHLGASAIDIGPKTIDKCAGLRWVCEQLGVKAADVIAFGDEWNDITMLEWAGRGVAMANADSRVQRAGNEITASNADDGVAIVLEELLA